MLRPERMSKVSVTGSRSVMSTVIDAIHELHRVHLSDYDGSWQGFDQGTPIEGADRASERLVTVRALESTLDLEEVDPDPGALPEDWEARLERVRTEINDLDDRRTEVRDELRQVDEKIDRIEPFAELGIDLDLLSGYDTVEVVVGEGDREAIEGALSASDDVRAYETFTGGDVIAIVAAPAEGKTNVIDDTLVGLEFARHEVPETDESPQQYVQRLESRKRDLEADLEEIDTELERIAREDGGFLLALEEELTVRVQRAEAPLQFATTEHAFVAEGWIPAEEYDRLVAALNDVVGDSVEVEELERADYDRHPHEEEVPDAPAHDIEGGDEETTEEREEAEEEPPRQPATDGGTSRGAYGDEPVTMDDDPPTVLDNLTPAKPFETLVKLVGQPRYTELDPTLLVFLTFPFAFGFMIGDIGYGLLYVGIGLFLRKFDSDAVKAMGTIGLWAGGFTVLFGYLYGELFGIHLGDLGLGFLPLTETLSKGLHLTNYANLWLVAAVLFGLVHLNLGLVMGFVNERRHGLKDAIYEKGSWLLALNGFFIWIFSTSGSGAKPDLLVGPDSALAKFVGFTGLPEVVGLIGLVMLFVGAVMVGIGEGIAGLAELPAWAFGHVLSYLRITAVLLAKAGMAFAVNLLAFGAYGDGHGHVTFHLPGTNPVAKGYTHQEFAGLIHTDPLWLTIPLAILVFVLGHILVMVLGITAAGIQMVRLEYVEFFQKFYEGTGEEYEPFGHERTGSAD